MRTHSCKSFHIQSIIYFSSHPHHHRRGAVRQRESFPRFLSKPVFLGACTSRETRKLGGGNQWQPGCSGGGERESPVFVETSSPPTTLAMNPTDPAEADMLLLSRTEITRTTRSCCFTSGREMLDGGECSVGLTIHPLSPIHLKPFPSLNRVKSWKRRQWNETPLLSFLSFWF